MIYKHYTTQRVLPTTATATREITAQHHQLQAVKYADMVPWSGVKWEGGSAAAEGNKGSRYDDENYDF